MRFFCLAWTLLPLAGCGAEPGGSSDLAVSTQVSVGSPIRDDEGRELATSVPRRRILSLMPSLTETVIALGASDRLVARTRFDVDSTLRDLPVVGGSTDPNLESIVHLEPDLIITWSGRGLGSAGERLSTIGLPVYAAENHTLGDLSRHIRQLGTLLGAEYRADSLLGGLHEQLDALRRGLAGAHRPTVFFVVWPDPPTTTGPGTFLDSLIELAGGRNLFADAGSRWPQVGLEEVVHRQPDFIVFASGHDGQDGEEWPDSAPGWRELEAIQAGRFRTVEADLFNRPGPRVTEAARLLAEWLHPDLAAAP